VPGVRFTPSPQKQTTMDVLHWDKIPQVLSKEDWKSISACGAPPGVYHPNMSVKDMKKWKAKLISGNDKRVEIRKSFQFHNGKKYPDNVNYTCQMLIVVRMKSKDEPDVLISTNGKIAMSHAEMIMFQTAIEEAKLVLTKK
jgi:hypothetical protein